MKLLKSLILIAVSAFLISGSFAQQNPASLEPLMPKNLQHPYLHFTQEELPALRRTSEERSEGHGRVPEVVKGM